MAGSSTPRVERSWLQPFVSFLVLQSTGSDHAQSMAALMHFLHDRVERGRGGATVVVASGIEGAGEAGVSDSDERTLDEIDALLYRRDVKPGWSANDGPYKDTRHELVLVMRLGNLIAVHGNPGLRDIVLRWLDRDPPPPFRRVPGPILHGAFLKGAARGLWLNGTHPRRPTKPDSKNISGSNLGDALSTFEDSTFALGSARATVPEDGSFGIIEGTVGTTPRKALVWNRASQTFDSFVDVLVVALAIVEETIALHGGVDRPFPVLAAEVDSLAGVAGAYEIGVVGIENLPTGPDVSEELLEAAACLDHALLNVRGDVGAPHFSIDVGLGGAVAGSIRCVVRRVKNRVELDLGWDGNPSDLASARAVLDALDHHDLLTVYYLSGHSIHGGAIYLPRVLDFPFPNWQFEDFKGFNVMKEKPADDHLSIHRLVGDPGDDSLFGWAAAFFNVGWLTCDDGSGEVADFVHLALDDTLSLIHIKAATTGSSTRQVSASAYEVVAGQASKNVGFLEPDTLLERLSDPAAKTRATWYDGTRRPDRHGFLASLTGRSRIALSQILIVQPHLLETRYHYLRGGGGATALEDATRLRRLETLLNAARGAVTGVGADLTVIAAK